MRCPSCGFENPDGPVFGDECGAPLPMPCAQCGFVNQPQAKFCGDCGVALPPRARTSTAPPLALRPEAPLRYTPGHLAEKILTTLSVLEGGRKQVTVLFADLGGSMTLLANRAPEEADLLLDLMVECPIETASLCQGIATRVMSA